jgi:3-hydroxyisobutyrate dehydrogenase
MAKPIGFIGLGQMGVPMASNLLEADYGVLGFDARPEAAAVLRTHQRFTWASSAPEVASAAEIMILMLPDSRIVDQLLWSDGLAARLQRGALLIDMGSSDPMHSKANAEKLAEFGVRFVDAPVSGGVKRAINGSLAIMIGGETAAVEVARPLLGALGKTLIHVGRAGAGHAVKALNNYVSAAGLLAVCEALTAAEKFGIDPKVVNQVMNASTGRNNTTENKVEPFMLSGAFNSGFALALMRKDLETAESFINAMHTPGKFAHSCVSDWREAEHALANGADHTAMYAYIQGVK